MDDRTKARFTFSKQTEGWHVYIVDSNQDFVGNGIYGVGRDAWEQVKISLPPQIPPHEAAKALKLSGFPRQHASFYIGTAGAVSAALSTQKSQWWKSSTYLGAGAVGVVAALWLLLSESKQ